MIIEINKDIETYKESVVLGLTAKQLLFSIASIIVGGGLVLLLYSHVGLTLAVYIAVPMVAPIALGGFYTYNGMNFYEYMKRKLYFAFANRAYTYVSTESTTDISSYQKEPAVKEKRKEGGRNHGHV